MLKFFENIIDTAKLLVKKDIEANPLNYGTLATSESFIREEAIRKFLDSYSGIIDVTAIGEERNISSYSFDASEYSIEDFLKGLARSESFTRIFIKDYDTKNSMNETYAKMRKEIYELLITIYKVNRLCGSDVLPNDAVGIYIDTSDMYANYNYYWSQSNKAIYEERVSLGD